MIVNIPVPASPSISERTLPPPAFPSHQTFLNDLFHFDEDVSIQQKLDVIMENQKALFKLFSSVIQERKDSVCHCNNCKAGMDQIRIGGWESLRIFSGIRPKTAGSVTLSTEG